MKSHRLAAHLNAVKTEVARLLGHAPNSIDVHANLFDQGFHSLAATRLAFILEEKYGVAVDSRVLFEYPTIHGIATFLTEHVEA